jgi:hypothetical protein
MKLNDIADDGLYTTAEAGQVLRLSVKTLYDLRQSNRLSFSGKTKRYLGRDILAFALEKEPTK